MVPGEWKMHSIAILEKYLIIAQANTLHQQTDGDLKLLQIPQQTYSAVSKTQNLQDTCAVSHLHEELSVWTIWGLEWPEHISNHPEMS